MGYVEREPKSKAGRRKIMLSGIVLEALREHEKIQHQARLKMGEKWREHGLIFSNMYGGFFNPSYVWYLFKKLLKKADLPDVRFHDLRHSVATILLAAKIDLKVVSELLGHSSIALRLISMGMSCQKCSKRWSRRWIACLSVDEIFY
jgi:hypothetical protein